MVQARRPDARQNIYLKPAIKNPPRWGILSVSITQPRMKLVKNMKFSFCNPPAYTVDKLVPHGQDFKNALAGLGQDAIFDLLKLPHLSSPVRIYAFYDIGAMGAGFGTLDYEIAPTESGKIIRVQPVKPTNTAYKNYNGTSEYDNNLRDTAVLAWDFKNELESAPEFGGRKLVATTIITATPSANANVKRVSEYNFADRVAYSSQCGVGMGNIIAYNPNKKVMESHPYGWVEAYNCENDPRNIWNIEKPNACASLNTMDVFVIDFAGACRDLYLRAYRPTKTK